MKTATTQKPGIPESREMSRNDDIDYAEPSGRPEKPNKRRRQKSTLTARPFTPPITPMEARIADELPLPPDWSYEPKWDGFRTIVWSRSDNGAGGPQNPRLDSRNGKPLLRYFPELEPLLHDLPAGTVVDGEVVVVIDGKLDFDALQNRIHPADSRVRLLAAQTPARIALFDLLALEGEDLRQRPFRERRALLMRLADELRRLVPMSSLWLLSPSTTDIDTARAWFSEFEASGFDGIVAKALDQPYVEADRQMIKVKHRRTVDCVVGGYRVRKDGRGVSSLLLGLYDESGELHFIGHCSSFNRSQAAALLDMLQKTRPNEAMPSPAGFGEHARHPGGPSRWSGGKELDFVPVSPELVIEISYDQLTGDRFRHATRFERWRPDKDPRDCTLSQLERPTGPGLEEMLRLVGPPRPG